MSARTSSQRRGPRTGKLALKIGFAAGAAGFVASILVGVVVAGKLSGHVTGVGAEDVINQTYLVAVFMALVAGAVAGGAAFTTASGVAGRLTDLSLAVSKMGRGTKAQVRVSGNDEVTVLGRALSGLASDVGGRSDDAEDGLAVDFDPKVRELRDKTLPEAFETPDGFELDGGLSAGSRGGMEYFDCKTSGDSTVLFHVSAGGSGAVAALAARMARDEIQRALGAGGNARKTLAHTNRVLHRNLPRGVCATATLLEIAGDDVKIYQAGSRVPVILCSAGELEDLTGEGLGLGLDSGPVFEKGLRSNTVTMTPGMRLVLLNDAGNRSEALVESVREHSPKHTTAFMNLVLGELEAGTGSGGLREDVIVMTVKRS